MLEEASSKPMAVRERLVEKARFLKQCRHRILVPSERNAMRIKALTTAEPSRSSARPALEEDLLEMVKSVLYRPADFARCPTRFRQGRHVRQQTKLCKISTSPDACPAVPRAAVAQRALLHRLFLKI